MAFGVGLRRRPSVVAGVLEDDQEQVADVVVGQRVADGLAGPLEADEPGVAQHPQLVGDGRLAHPELTLECAHRKVSFPQKGAEQAHPGEVAHHL